MVLFGVMRLFLEISVCVPAGVGLRVVFLSDIDAINLDLMKIDIHLPHPMTKIRLL